MEPALGFEPRTDGLQNRSSTAELSRQVVWNRRDLCPDGAGRSVEEGFASPAAVRLLPNNK